MEPSPQPSQLAYAAAASFGRPCALPVSTPQPQLPSYPQIQQLHRQQEQQLQMFWLNQMHEIEQTSDFKNHSLPLARIKKIMKADEDVRMISAEAPVIFAKACEMFILELTLRSWIHTEENKRRTLQKNDIAAAVTRTDIFDFLVDIVPRDDLREDGLLRAAALQGMGLPMDALPYYCVPAHPQMIGKPSDQAADHPPQSHSMACVWQLPPALGEDKGAPNA